MQFITYSLGVECSFCHVEGASEKDDKKPKQTARKMMQMMFAINQETFEGKREVTCYSCHRGSSHPQATPTADAGAQAVSEKVQDEDEDESGLASTQTYRPPSRFSPSMRMPWGAPQPLESCLPGSKREPSIWARDSSPSKFSVKSQASG